MYSQFMMHGQKNIKLCKKRILHREYCIVLSMFVTFVWKETRHLFMEWKTRRSIHLQTISYLQKGE